MSELPDRVIATSYDDDFYAWTQHQAALLRAGKPAELDLEHVAEELESMGRSEKRELVNQLAVLLAHLLKWHYQPEHRTRSWRLTIKEQRLRVLESLTDSPSLKSDLESSIATAYARARIKAAKETRLDEDKFPAHCPWCWEEILEGAA